MKTESSADWLQLFRVLFPSWKFFDDVGSRPTLSVRIRRFGEDYSEWEPLLKPISRTWGSLLVNPDGNLRHAIQNLLERLVRESQTDTGDFSANLTYRLLVNWVRSELNARGTDPKAKFQFRVRVETAGANDDVLVSTDYGVAED